MSLFIGNFDDYIQISIGGKVFGGWTQANVSRSVSEMTGQFSMTIHDPMMLLFGSSIYSQFTATAEPGEECEIYVAGEKFLTGYIDSRSANKSATSHSVTLSGRGKSRNIVDSSHIDTKNQYNEQKPTQILEKVAKPFGIKINKRIDSEEKIPVSGFFMGDNAFDYMHEVARGQGFTLTEDKDGNIDVRGKDKGAAAGPLVQGENLLTYSVTKSEEGRHSKYQGKGQSVPKDKVRGKAANQPASETVDEGVKSYRPLVAQIPGDVDINKVKRATTHEAARRAGGSLKAQVTLYGYRGSNGQLWEPDTMAFVYIPDEAIAEELLIESVGFAKSNAGSIASLSLTRKEAFEAKPTKGKGSKKGSKSKKQGPKKPVSNGTKGNTGQITLGEKPVGAIIRPGLD